MVVGCHGQGLGAEERATIAEAQPPFTGVIQVVDENIDPVAEAVTDRDQHCRGA